MSGRLDTPSNGRIPHAGFEQLLQPAKKQISEAEEVAVEISKSIVDIEELLQRRYEGIRKDLALSLFNIMNKRMHINPRRAKKLIGYIPALGRINIENVINSDRNLRKKIDKIRNEMHKLDIVRENLYNEGERLKNVTIPPGQIQEEDTMRRNSPTGVDEMIDRIINLSPDHPNFPHREIEKIIDAAKRRDLHYLREELPDYVKRRPLHARYLTKGHSHVLRARMLTPSDPDYPHEEVEVNNDRLRSMRERAVVTQTADNQSLSAGVASNEGKLTPEEAAECANFLGADDHWVKP